MDEMDKMKIYKVLEHIYVKLDRIDRSFDRMDGGVDRTNASIDRLEKKCITTLSDIEILQRKMINKIAD